MYGIQKSIFYRLLKSTRAEHNETRYRAQQYLYGSNTYEFMRVALKEDEVVQTMSRVSVQPTEPAEH